MIRPMQVTKDCGDGLVCVAATSLATGTDLTDRCCPPDGKTYSDSRCAPNGSTAVVSSGGSSSSGGASTGGTSSDGTAGSAGPR